MSDRKKAYHVTPKSNLLSILERGLVPSIGERSKRIENKSSVFLFPTKDDLETAMYQWLGLEFEDLEDDLVFLEVDISNIEYTVGSFELIVDTMIPSKNIIKVYDELWCVVDLDPSKLAKQTGTKHVQENTLVHQEFVDLDMQKPAI